MDQEIPAPLAEPKPKTAQEIRREREAAALRANLRKRKDQARAREGDDAPDERDDSLR